MPSLVSCICGMIALSTPVFPGLQKVLQLPKLSHDAHHTSWLTEAASTPDLATAFRLRLRFSNTASSLSKFRIRHAHVTAALRSDEDQDRIPLIKPVKSMAELQRAAAALRSEGGDAKARFAELLNVSMENGFAPDAGQLA
eukprot:3279222-Pleurochrysis_carterae.AAC.3